MIARALTLPRLRPARRTRRTTPPPRSRRADARATVRWGLIAVVVANAALAAVMDVSRREWRDPEFGYRLRRLKEWKAAAPHRPLVLAVGTSRVQQGLCPDAMGLADGPTDPLVFNFGCRGAQPLLTALNVHRILDAGVRPDFVLVEFTPVCVQEYDGIAALRRWPNRFTPGDTRWMADAGFIDPHARGVIKSLARWAVTSLAPWSSHRQVLIPHWLPDWAPKGQRASLAGERMDPYGFTAMGAGTTTTSLYQRNPAACRERFAALAARDDIAETTRRAHKQLVERCRTEGIPVAFVRVPLAPIYTGWLTPDARRAVAAYADELIREWGVPVFAPPDWLRDDDFADGNHLLPDAARRYSRWLADTHLRPWLARQP